MWPLQAAQLKELQVWAISDIHAGEGAQLTHGDEREVTSTGTLQPCRMAASTAPAAASIAPVATLPRLRRHSTTMLPLLSLLCVQTPGKCVLYGG